MLYIQTRALHTEISDLFYSLPHGISILCPSLKIFFLSCCLFRPFIKLSEIYVSHIFRYIICVSQISLFVYYIENKFDFRINFAFTFIETMWIMWGKRKRQTMKMQTFEFGYRNHTIQNNNNHNSTNIKILLLLPHVHTTSAPFRIRMIVLLLANNRLNWIVHVPFHVSNKRYAGILSRFARTQHIHMQTSRWSKWKELVWFAIIFRIFGNAANTIVITVGCRVVSVCAVAACTPNTLYKAQPKR